MELNNQKILIHHDDLIMDMQIAFNSLYPFLKIDFIETDIHSKYLKSTLVDPKTTLKQLAIVDGPQKINISSYRTVADVLHDFEQMLGVLGEMSRKSGNVWNKISITEGWTLESQNAAGEFISSEMTRIGK